MAVSATGLLQGNGMALGPGAGQSGLWLVGAQGAGPATGHQGPGLVLANPTEQESCSECFLKES